jgi:hypothetical protein
MALRSIRHDGSLPRQRAISREAHHWPGRVLHRFGAATASTSAGEPDPPGEAMPSTDTCPRCHGDGILRHRSKGANDCPHCGGLGRLVTGVSDAGLSDSLKAMIWPYTIHMQPLQRELFTGTILALLQELPPGTIGPGTVAQACRTAQRQVLRGEVHHGARPGKPPQGAAERRAVLTCGSAKRC